MDINRPRPISVFASVLTGGVATMYGHPDYFNPNANASAHRFLKVFLLTIAAIAMFALFR